MTAYDLVSEASNSLNASSISIMSVFVARALVKPTLCCMRPDSWFGY